MKMSLKLLFKSLNSTPSTDVSPEELPRVRREKGGMAGWVEIPALSLRMLAVSTASEETMRSALRTERQCRGSNQALRMNQRLVQLKGNNCPMARLTD